MGCGASKKAGEKYDASEEHAQDTTGDGKVDKVALDTTGDGHADTQYLDTTGDGKVDTIVHMKKREDGSMRVTRTMKDTTGDGKVDTVTHGDSVLKDTCGDGHIDTLVSGSADAADSLLKEMQGGEDVDDDVARKSVGELPEEPLMGAPIRTLTGGKDDVAAEEDAAEEEEDDDDDDDDEMDDAIYEQQVARFSQTGARSSVSAEAYGEYNKMKEFEAPVYPKSDEERERITSACRRSFIFRVLDDAMLAKVIDAMQLKEIPSGETVISQGAEVTDDEPGLFTLESGEMAVYKWFPDKGPEKPGLHVHTYKNPGDSFGELALLYNCPRAATVTSSTDCTLWWISRAAFNGLVKQACIKRRLQYEQFIGKVGVLQGLDSAERAKLCDVLKPQAMKVGDVIIEEGDHGDIFYIVESGQAEATTQAHGKVMEYKTGDFFGELALKQGSDGLRKATITCSEAGMLAVVDRACFTRVLGPLQSLDEKEKEYIR